jgi:hypothetical protein
MKTAIAFVLFLASNAAFASDDMAFCKAFAESNLAACAEIGDGDRRAICEAAMEREDEPCKKVKNKDMQTACVALSGFDRNYCNRIKNKKTSDIYRFCVGTASQEAKACNDVEDIGLKAACFTAVSGSSHCEAISN